ncbi:MAG: hypothetical protein U0350_26590 [Caldilineaceae bacterium]
MQPAIAFAVAPVPPVSYQLGQPFKLRYGDKALLTAEKLSISFVSVENDSRCPARVECVVAGEATILLALQHGNENVVKMAVSTNPRQLRTPSTLVNSAYQVQLVALDPLPEANQTIPVEQYVATLIVIKASAVPTATATPAATATPLPTPTPTPTLVLTPIRSDAKVLTATLDAPFQLGVGQTAEITSEAFKVTLRSASSDSGCFTEDDCSSMQFNGTLALQKDDQKNLMDIMASFDAGQAFTTDFAGYTVALTSIKKLTDGSFAALFVVSLSRADNPTQPTPQPAQFSDRCPDLGQDTAEMLLQEAVQDQTVTNLQFGPLPTEGDEIPGLCGYVSKAYHANEPIDPKLPHLATAVKADHAVAVAKLKADDENSILHIADLIHAANPDNQAYNVDLLKAMLASGDGEGVLERLNELAQGSENLQAEFVNDLQENALWVWQTYTGGHFAVLLAYDGRAFTLVSALLGEDVDETAVQAVATTLIQATEPTPTPTRTATPEPGPYCDAISKAEAEAILSEPVHDQPVPGDEVCGYDSIAHKPSNGNEPGEALYYAVAGVFDQSKAPTYLMQLATELHKENPRGGLLPYATIKGLLDDNFTGEAFKLLPELAKGLPNLSVQVVPDTGKQALWLWGAVNGKPVATFLALNQDDDIIAVFARVNGQRNQLDLQAKMAMVVRKLLRRSQDEQPTPPTATPEITRTPVATVVIDTTCKGLQPTDAETILGEKLKVAPDQGGNLCGYGGVAQKLAGAGRLLALSTHGVAAGVLSDAAVSQFLLRLAETIHQDNPKGNEIAFNKIRTQLSAGMTEDALTELDQLVSGSPKWEIGNITDLGKFGVWLVRTLENGDHLVFCFAPRQDTGTILVVAQVKAEQEPETISKAVLSVAEALAE